MIHRRSRTRSDCHLAMGMTADRHAGGERFRCDPVCHGHVGRRVGIPVSRHRVGEPDRDAVHGCPVVPCCLMSCASPRRSYWPCSFPRAPAPRRPSVSAQQSAPSTRATRAARRRAKDEVEGCVSMAEVDVDSRPKTSTLIDGDSRASQG